MLLLLFLLVGCDRPDLAGVGLVGDGIGNPFPSRFLVDDGHLAIPPEVVPVGIEGTPLPVGRLSWRTGFSPAQVSVVHLPDVDPAALPSWREAPTLQDGVLLVDLDDGRLVGAMAELDANDEESPLLLVRPMEVLVPGHDVAVVVTTDVAPRPARFDALVDGRPPADLAEDAPHYRALVDDLEALGVARDRIALAWDFPIGDGAQPLRSALAQLDPPGTFAFDHVREEDAGDLLVPLGWRAATGTFEVQDFLLEDALAVDDRGDVAVQGTREAFLYVHVPDSVKDAPAGTVPILLFGHGIFGSADLYLDTLDDPHGVQQLAEDGGFIVVATEWLGLRDVDRVPDLEIGQDFGRMPRVPDRLVQAQVSVRTLLAMVREGALLDDPVFRGADGQKLPTGEVVVYHGISLGGIEGAVLVGSGAPVDAAVLHVGGAAWSTMLERSTHWIAFHWLLEESLPDPKDRQRLYALSQLFWDPVDPVSWVDGLADRPVLWQEAVGDEQVPNMTTRLLARSAGVPLVEPAVEPPWGIDKAQAPLPAGSSGLVQLDPEVALPPEVNQPPPITFAHSRPRPWPGTLLQAVDFLTPGQLGRIVHHCGSAPCSASNPGP